MSYKEFYEYIIEPEENVMWWKLVDRAQGESYYAVKVYLNIIWEETYEV